MRHAVEQAQALLEALAHHGLLQSDHDLARVAGLETLMRVAQLLVTSRLHGIREQYAANNQSLMHEPEPAIVPQRDALVEDTDFLRYIDVLDLVSDAGLSCVAPRLHRGWQDRVESCREARRITAGVLGFRLGGPERDALLAGLAVGNRVFRVPPPVHVERARIEAAMPPVLRLITVVAPKDVSARFVELASELAGRGS